MKPNNAKVIVLFNQHTWRGLPVDVAVPVGKRILRALKWLQQFAENNNRMLLLGADRGGRCIHQTAVGFSVPTGISAGNGGTGATG
jgi:hypothetical protein